MTKLREIIDPKLIDEVVDEIVYEIKEKEKKETENPEVDVTFNVDSKASGPKRVSKDDLLKLKSQLEDLRRAFDIDEIEVRRDLTEKFSEMNNDLQNHIIRMDSEVNRMKKAMMKLQEEIQKLEGKSV